MPLVTTCIGSYPKPRYVPRIAWMHENVEVGEVEAGDLSPEERLAVPPINSVRRRNPDLSGWCPIAFVTRTRSCFTAFSRSFAIAPCDSSRSSRLVINWTSFGAPAKPVAGTLKIPGFLRRTEFIEGTPTLPAAVPSIYSIVPPNDGSALRHGHHFEPVDFVIDHGRGHHDAYSAGSCQRTYARACGCRQRPRCHREELIESERGWSGREAFVTMMQTADLGQGNDRSGPGRLNGSSIRCVLAERQVGP